MKFDFYLSEMSVSDLHGGGLTLQRIIGDGLKDISWFIHVNRFATDVPAADEFFNRTIDIPSFWERDTVRKTIGNSLSAKLAKKLPAIKKHAQRAAKIINEKFESEQVLSALICPQGANSLFTLEALKALRAVNYVTWVMDDHLIEFTDNQWRYPDGVEEVFAKHLQEANHVFVISPAMQHFYLDRFGVSSTVLFGSSDLLNGATTNAGNKGPLKIGYFGAVASWQLDALKIFADALKGTKDELHIYSTVQKLPDALNLKEVVFKGRIDPGEVLPAMRNYNAVLLPISFQEKIRNMSQFNIATKMGEYLASGVPILAVGPPYAAMIDYLHIKKAAFTATSANVKDIRTSVALLRDQYKVVEILNNAKKLVLNEVGTQPMRKKWLSVING
ncbi:glycosyltransferase family protein [Mucilaginibacter segetis]|uniref:Uncharacterized protein n=1 Tax=Mucilaginibacter segetis TaxID=2793071 RepID=A0A934PWF0_9SPHI|nr:hypothetical protein [Mucilaginibacter segetis]MBK0380655.1 hypothetical protein [Mucilaginibacter segetis]